MSSRVTSSTWCFCRFSQKFGETLQVAAIGQYGVQRQAFLDAQVVQKYVNGSFHSDYPAIPCLPGSAPAD